MSDESPPLLRPVPRRPFNLNLEPATPDDDSYDNERSYDGGSERQSKEDLSLSGTGIARFLNPRSSNSDSAPISRTGSSMNMNSSTLYGIYSPTTSRDRVFGEPSDTPWGTGAQTPVRRPSVDDATYQLMRERSHVHRRRSSYRSIDTTMHHSNPSAVAITAVALAARGGVLFALGVGYGMLLTRLKGSSQWLSSSTASLTEGVMEPTQDWTSLAFWGLAGLVWGGSMPWFDRMWDGAFQQDDEDESAISSSSVVDVDLSSPDDQVPKTDFALVMRGIGAFVGIIFAIRKLAWSSTLQMSVTLALVNPLLWWIIDRSQVGFVLSAAVGLIGSLFFLGVNPDLMPAPPANLVLLRGVDGAGGGTANNASAAGLADGAASAFPLAGIASQETVETGVWMLSVLFCSCLCFGNIGRRLAWDKSATGRGRWGGVR